MPEPRAMFRSVSSCVASAFGPDLCYLNSHKFNAVCHIWLIEIYAHFDIEIIMAMWDFHGGPQNRISTRKLRANYLSRFVVRDFCRLRHVLTCPVPLANCKWVA